MTRGKRRIPWDLPTLGLAVVLLITNIVRFSVRPHRPLWLDEVWTAMIASQPTFTTFVHQCVLDINAPLYYIVARLWTPVAGLSDAALRAPAALFGLLAPLIALTPRTLIDRPTRLLWCALIACWIPGLWLSWEARCYTLTLMLGVANAITFAGVLRSPTQGRAWAWTVTTSLLILSHYYGAVLAGVQGVAYLAIHRRRAVSTWPAALAFIPGLAAIVVEAGRLWAFVRPGHAWMAVLTPRDLPLEINFVSGLPVLTFAAACWIALAILAHFKGKGRLFSPTDHRETFLWIVVACSGLGALLSIGLGFLRPMFTERYLTAFVPALLMGVSLLGRWFNRQWQLAPAWLVGVFLATSVLWARTAPSGENAFNFETASTALMKVKPRNLVFLWDGPTTPDDSAMREVGGFFFARAGNKIPVTPAHVSHGQDPNHVLASLAKPPGSAILWLYDLEIAGTAAIDHPPSLPDKGNAFRCDDFGERRFGVIACTVGNRFQPLTSAYLASAPAP